jgi:aryl sulfotransferase
LPLVRSVQISALVEEAQVDVEAVERPIEREYRSVILDNRRWKRFVARPSDIFVCTAPKCGTTWMQTIVASLLFPDGAPARVSELSPWLDARFQPVEDVIGRLNAQTHRRFIKTHTPADGIPWHSTCSYIVVGRDGRDAIMSYFNHMRSLQPALLQRLAASASADGIDLSQSTPPPVEDIHKFFAWCLEENPAWFVHAASFWPHRVESNVLFVHYNDMKADLDAQMRRVAAFLDIDINESSWADQVERCTFASMKRRSDEIADFEMILVGGADTFLYKGTNGRWRDVLTSEELDRFDQRAQELLPPEAIAWATSGQVAFT